LSPETIGINHATPGQAVERISNFTRQRTRASSAKLALSTRSHPDPQRESTAISALVTSISPNNAADGKKMNKKQADAFISEIRERFSSEELAADAKIFYTGPISLQRGKFAVLGLNPAPPKNEGEDPTLSGNFSAFPSKSGNDNYHDASPLGGRFKMVIDFMGEPAGRVFTSNVIFKRTKSANDLSGKGHLEAQRCWPILKDLLDIVSPNLIVALGSGRWSAYDYLLSSMRAEGAVDTSSFPSGHGNWRVCRARGSISQRQTVVVGLPHLSWYKPKVASEGFQALLAEINTAQTAQS
jgi:uracil-DNA glycosylase